MIKFHRDLSYLTIGDLHGGHHILTTRELTDHLDTYFGNYSPTHAFASLDIIFIAGDVFEGPISFASEDGRLMTAWVGRLMLFCYQNGIKLRVLEGTPSHDNKQSRMFDIMYNMMTSKPDYKYVEVLHIEKMDDLGLSVLYMPDEWAGSTAKAEKEVFQLMKTEGLEKVDIAVMHGMFEYQVPKLASENVKHRAEVYLSVVNFFITIGHVHTHSTLDRIIAEGSFDRLAHGEEEPKGGVVCYIRQDGNHLWAFVENKLAKIFKTIHIRGTDLDKAVTQIDKVAGAVPDNSQLRIKAKAGHPVLNVLNEIRLKYPMLFFKKITEEDDHKSQQMVQLVTGLDDEYISISITRDNVVPLIREEILSKHNLTGEQQTRLERVLAKAHR